MRCFFSVSNAHVRIKAKVPFAYRVPTFEYVGNEANLLLYNCTIYYLHLLIKNVVLAAYISEPFILIYSYKEHTVPTERR